MDDGERVPIVIEQPAAAAAPVTVPVGPEAALPAAEGAVEDVLCACPQAEPAVIDEA